MPELSDHLAVHRPKIAVEVRAEDHGVDERILAPDDEAGAVAERVEVLARRIVRGSDGVRPDPLDQRDVLRLVLGRDRPSLPVTVLMAVDAAEEALLPVEVKTVLAQLAGTEAESSETESPESSVTVAV